MKAISTLTILVAILLLASCTGKTSALLETASPNGKAKLTVIGKRLTAVDPWQVEMKVKAYTFKEGSLKFEVYTDDLNGQTVLFEWVDEHNCNITFKLNDNTERHFHLIASPGQMQMAEV